MSSKVSSRNTIYKEGKKGFLAEIVLNMWGLIISLGKCVYLEKGISQTIIVLSQL